MNSDINNIKKKIEKAKVISFDIFDTLLIRDFYRPADVSNYIEHKYHLAGFQQQRITAEEVTRMDHSECSDITYKLIYQNLSQYDSRLEKDIEYKSCIINPEIKQLYDYAISQGKKIIAISDMYLDKNFIEALLYKNGVEDIDQIYVSGELNKTKSGGELYQHVLNNLHIDAAELLHIGDNYQSDYIMARELGISAVYYKALRDGMDEYSNETLVSSLNHMNTPQASLFTGALVNHYPVLKKKSYWYQFGFQYSGILLFNFVTYIYEYAKTNSITRIYFMARDGKIIKKAFDLLYGEHSEIKTYYMYASRRLFYIPSINFFNEESIETLLESTPGTPYIDIVNRLGFDWLICEAKKYFPDINKQITTSEDRKVLKEFFLEYRTCIQKEIEKERKNLINYIDTIDLRKDKQRLLIDIGWECSSQKYLESMLEEKFHGIYFATLKSTYMHKNIHGYVCDTGQPRKNCILLNTSLPVIELLFSGDHYSITAIDDDLNPIYQNKSVEEEIRICNAKEIHTGVLAFINLYKDIYRKYELQQDKNIDIVVLRSLLLKPSKKDIIHIAQIPHMVSLGEASYKCIISSLDEPQGDRFNTQDLWSAGKIRYKELINQKHYKSLDFLEYLIVKIQHCYSYSIGICARKIFHKISKKLKRI